MISARRMIAGVLVGLMGVPALVTPAAAGGSTPCWDPHRPESGFVHRINDARSAGGLGALRLDPELSKAARVHSREMARKVLLFHTPSNMLRYRITNWVILGENVGVGGSVRSLHSAFMDSPSHRANVLHDSYRNVGVGTIERNGRLWVTVIFEGVSDPGTPLVMRSC
jgi:hypothetical protein